MGYIYIHTNKINGKKYVGQTVQDPNKRWGSNGCNYLYGHFYSAIQKYGWDSFDHDIIEVCDSIMDFMEEHLIQLYNTMDSKDGYNSESGGNKNKYISEETRRKMSESHKGKHPSEGTRNKLSNANIGQKRSEEAKRHMSESHKGKPHPNTKEQRLKISESLKGRTYREEWKEKLHESNQSISEEYKLYKSEGGTLKWNEWRHLRANNSSQT